MKLEKIEKKEDGRFLTRYDLHYTLKSGQEKVYEMVSRTPLAEAEDVAGKEPDGVVLVIFNRDGSRVLLNQEFRPAVNRVIYNFPAGLRDPGESPAEAAARELWEETGLHLQETIACYGSAYGSVGLSNESASLFLGRANDAEPFGGRQEAAEEIEPVWLTRGQARQVISSGAVTGRVQMLLVMWAEDPLGLCAFGKML
jgi:ADP-ribose pyrophosphatase